MRKEIICAAVLLFVMVGTSAAGDLSAESETSPANITRRSTEQFHDIGGDTLADAVPGRQRRYLDGVQPESPENLTSSFSQLFHNASSDSRRAIRNAIASVIRVAVIVVVAAAARGFSTAMGGECNTLIDLAGSLGCTAILIRDFTSILTLCRNALEEISVFSGVLQPILATALSMGGNAATATTLQVASMLVFDFVIRLVNQLLLPGVCAYLAISTVDAATGGELLRGIGEGIKSFASGALKLILTLFTTYLAIAGGISAGVDRLTLKTAKFAVSGVVPVVGGVISDAAETMLSGAALLRGSVGVFGMLCVTAICLVPFLQAGASYLCYRAGAAILSPLCSGNLRRLLENIGAGFGLLLGMLGACCMILYLELVYMVAMVKPV